MVAFLGVPADERLPDADPLNLPDAEQHEEPVLSSQRHDRLIAPGSLLTVERAGHPTQPTSSFHPWPDLLNHLGVSRSLLYSQTNPREERPATQPRQTTRATGGPRPRV